MAYSAAIHRQADGLARREVAGISGLSIRVAHRIDDVACAWSRLEAHGIESPGQSLALVRLWIDAHAIPEADQVFLLAEQAGEPLALLALRRRRIWGVTRLGWFMGAHVGCNAPLADPARLAALGEAGRRRLWAALADAARQTGGDLLHLPAMPAAIEGQGDLYADFGRSVPGDTLYRAEFDSWQACDTTQRNKSRRKHDRQQGDKLAAMGEITFASVGDGGDAAPLVETMFTQRAARFAEMGVVDPFASRQVRRFYADALRAGAQTGAYLDVLRLDGDVVATRYNIRRGARIFCLISSMSTAPELRPGSPGKQILLRIMQTIFDAGARSFDMGAGLTDEKRHWCNVHLALRDHVVPLTLRGRIAAWALCARAKLKSRIKSDGRLLAFARGLRSRVAVRRASRGEAGED